MANAAANIAIAVMATTTRLAHELGFFFMIAASEATRRMPPRFSKNTQRLDSFLKMLPRHRRYAFEFRDDSWYSDEIFELLHRHDVALCFSDHADAPTPWQVTSRHIYIRDHGPSGRYRGSYSPAALHRWADAVLTWKARGCDVFVYFNNDQKAAAPADAARLIRLLHG